MIQFKFIHKSNKPHFLSVLWCNNPFDRLGEHSKSLQILYLYLIICILLCVLHCPAWFVMLVNQKKGNEHTSSNVFVIKTFLYWVNYFVIMTNEELSFFCSKPRICNVRISHFTWSLVMTIPTSFSLLTKNSGVTLKLPRFPSPTAIHLLVTEMKEFGVTGVINVLFNHLFCG